ncbi:MAG TPA: ATP-binding protein [Opitutaceae bacterium]|nr:ATP-binding protein [Opitutaceae bacterium]
MNSRSIRFRLTVWQATLFTAVFVLLGTLLYVQLRHYLDHSLLDTQSRRARQIAATLLGKAGGNDERLAAQIEGLYAPELSDRFIRLTRGDGSVFYLSGSPQDHAFEPADVPLARPPFTRESARRQSLPGGRVLLIAAVPGNLAGGASCLVEVGIDGAPVEIMLNRLLLLLGLGLPIVVAVAAAGGYGLVQSALDPVAGMARKAELITQHNLTERLPVVRSGDELERLSLSLNHMIQRLDEAFQQSKRFVADASHELRTPLTILRGELEELAGDAALAAGQRERIGSLLEEAERLTRIVEQLLTISRLDAGEAQAEAVTFDLAALAIATAEQMAQLAEDRRISVNCTAEGRVMVEGDRARLKQVVVNLLDNAVKYTPVGGEISLRVAAQGGMALLEVTDTGIGIPESALPHVFERFFRVDQARSREPDGAGLGLAIVKAICQAHGGEAEAESAPGRGSRFRVRLPRAA